MGRARAFVGRAAELLHLERALADARGGNGRFVLVTGKPGIGKTTLVEELLSREQDTRLQLGMGRAWEGAGAPPWWIWREALRPLGVDLSFPRTLIGDEARFACLEIIAEAVRDLADTAPLVLILDDLQWADVASLLAAKLVARSLAGTALLLIGTLRDPTPSNSDIQDVIADLRREATLVPLAPLGRSEIANLLTRHGVDAASAIDATLSLSGGNPLLATRLLEDAGVRDELAGGRTPLVASGLTSVLARHLDQLDAFDQTIVEWAAVSGDPLDVPIIVAASGRSADDVRAAIERGAHAGLLAPASGSPRSRLFTHDLFRNATCERIDPPRRADMHRAIARALEARPEMEVRIAEHLFAADPDDTSAGAALASLRAARAAMARLAYEQAIIMAERSALADERAGRRGSLATALALLAEARFHAGDARGSTAVAERAITIATDVVDEAEPYARAALAVGLRRTMGFPDRALVGVLEEALLRMDRCVAEDVAMRCALEARLGAALQPAVDPSRALETARRAIERSRAHGDPALIARTLHEARPAFRLLEPLHERHALDAELLSLATMLRDANLAAHASGRLFWLAIEAGDAITADLHLAEYERLAQSSGTAQHGLGASTARAARAAMCGAWDEAERILARLDATRAQWSGVASVLPTDIVVTMRAAIGTARADGSHVDVALREAPPMMRPLLELVFDARLGRLESGRRAFAACAAALLGKEPPFIARVLLGEACVLLRETSYAERLTALLEPWSGRHAVGTPLAIYWGSVDRLLAGFAALTGDTVRAERLYDAAISAEEALGAFPHARQTRSERAALLSHRSTPPRPSRDAARSRTRSGPPIHLTHEGDTWVIRFGEEEARTKDVVGLHYLAYLLARPDVAVPAVELFAARAHAPGGAPGPMPSGNAGEILDAKAVASYRARARDLREVLDAAVANSDLGAIEVARHELDLIEDELRAAVGLGGRLRRSGSETERVRVSVTTRIRKAIDRLRERSPLAAHHLGAAIRTGSTCIYNSPP